MNQFSLISDFVNRCTYCNELVIFECSKPELIFNLKLLVISYSHISNHIFILETTRSLLKSVVQYHNELAIKAINMTHELLRLT